MKLSFLLAVSILFCGCQQFKSPSDPALVESEFIYDSGPFPQIHASTIVETPKGMVAAWFGGTEERNPDVGIWVSRQVDGKWTKCVEVANGIQMADSAGKEIRYPTWNPVLFQPQDGPLLLFYKVGPSPEAWWGMLTKSRDNGKTWETPHRLPDGILGPIKNKPIQLPDGSILCASSEEKLDTDGQSKWTIHFEHTKDFGETWDRTPPLNDGETIQAIQPSILTLGGDKLLAIGRTRQNKIFEIESDDGGNTWSEMGLSNLPNNNSGLDAVTMRNGTHALVYNHVDGVPGQWGGKRSPLNLAVSKDGKSWEAARVLENDAGEYSYPAIIQSSDGLLHITYSWNRKKVKHIVVDPSKLIPLPIVNGQWP